MDKTKIIMEKQKHKKDTGSAEVQAALLKERVKTLTDHLKAHPKDNHSRRGLIAIINRRKKLERYLSLHSKE